MDRRIGTSRSLYSCNDASQPKSPYKSDEWTARVGFFGCRVGGSSRRRKAFFPSSAGEASAAAKTRCHRRAARHHVNVNGEPSSRDYRSTPRSSRPAARSPEDSCELQLPKLFLAPGNSYRERDLRPWHPIFSTGGGLILSLVPSLPNVVPAVSNPRYSKNPEIPSKWGHERRQCTILHRCSRSFVLACK